MKLTLLGSVPSKKNSKRVFTHGRRTLVLPSENHEAWEKEHLYLLKRSQKAPAPCSVEITLYPKDLRRGDLDNRASSILDLLCKADILPDDSWKVVRELHLYYGGTDKDRPRAEVEITPC